MPSPRKPRASKFNQKPEPPEKLKELPFQLDLEARPDDFLPYQKVDAFRFARVNDDIALSMFQLNYQLIADRVQKGEGNAQPLAIPPMIKVVMNRQSFKRLLDQAQEIAKKAGIE